MEVYIDGVKYVPSALSDPGLVAKYGQRSRNCRSAEILVEFMESGMDIAKVTDVKRFKRPAESLTVQAERMGIPAKCFAFGKEFYLARTDREFADGEVE